MKHKMKSARDADYKHVEYFNESDGTITKIVWESTDRYLCRELRDMALSRLKKGELLWVPISDKGKRHQVGWTLGLVLENLTEPHVLYVHVGKERETKHISYYQCFLYEELKETRERR